MRTMKKALYILLAASLINIVSAEEGRILRNGPIGIELNARPNFAIQGRPKINYLDEELDVKPSEDMVLTDEQIDFLAKNIDITRSIPPELAARIKEKNPDFKFLQYTASTYLKQDYWQHEEVESKYMQHLAMCPAAVLNDTIDSKITEFFVSPYVDKSLKELQEKYASIRSLKDAIPIYASAVKDDWSKNTEEFLFFIRIGAVFRTSYISPFFRLPSVGPEWTPEGGHTYKLGLPYIFYLPLGKPLESPTPGDFDAIRYKDTNVFMRRYENGLVLINPTYDDSRQRFKGQENRIDQDLDADDAPHDPISVPTTYTVKLDRRYIDPLTGDYVEGEITMPPISGKILLKEPSL